MSSLPPLQEQDTSHIQRRLRSHRYDRASKIAGAFCGVLMTADFLMQHHVMPEDSEAHKALVATVLTSALGTAALCKRKDYYDRTVSEEEALLSAWATDDATNILTYFHEGVVIANETAQERPETGEGKGS